MTKNRKTYSAEYKKEAVRLAQTQGLTKAQVARDLGLADNLLGKWCLQSQAQGSKAFPGHGNPADEELAKLRKEVELLRREREILKKAVGIFSQLQP
jgi:transposase